MALVTRTRSVSIDSVDKRFDGALVLENVCLDVEAGEILALLGPSGCGKTTLLRTIAGLERLDAGTIRLGDELVAGPDRWVAPERRSVGMVFQDWALFPHMSVARNVGYGLGRRAGNDGVVDEALAMVGMAGLGDRSPSTLSGGQQQRVALARALAPRPGVLLLDEPFSNLDTTLRVEVRTEVHALLLDLGITAVFVTHDQEEAFVVGDRVAVMHDGRIEQVDRPDALYTRPASRWIAGFVGSGTFWRAAARGGAAATPFGKVPIGDATDGPVDVLLRPEQLIVWQGDGAVVELIEYYGHDALLVARLPDNSIVRVRTPPDVPYRRGDSVAIRYRGGTTVAFPAEPA